MRLVQSSGTVSAVASGVTPYGLALDSNGNVVFSDSGSQTVRRVDATGTVTTVVGNGRRGFSGDGGPAAATFNTPLGIAFGPTGTLE